MIQYTYIMIRTCSPHECYLAKFYNELFYIMIVRIRAERYCNCSITIDTSSNIHNMNDLRYGYTMYDQEYIIELLCTPGMMI